MTTFQPPPPRADLKWIGVDLDGTLALPVWTPDNPTSLIGDPIWTNVAKLKIALAKGFKAVVHTSRPWTDYEGIESWLHHWQIPYSQIQCGKPLFYRYIDDRGVNAGAEEWV